MKVLIVDDAMFLRKTLKDMLIRNNITVIGEAVDGLDAVEKYKELKPELVTMDITMPGMGGMEALQAILKYDPNAKILMCSAMGRPDFQIESIKLGAKGFITKPFKEDQVVKEITSFIQNDS